MEEHNIYHTVHNGERVASIYADTYFNDDYCSYDTKNTHSAETTTTQTDLAVEDEWKSPSDLLIGIVNLTPPFTSKITRGQTHQGILAIGNTLLEAEQNRFTEYMRKLIAENDAAWSYILEKEKAAVARKIKQKYQEILMNKSKILITEINEFYESNLKELENHLRKEVTTVLDSAHASIISDLNMQIKEKLQHEREILENILKERYNTEIYKIKDYYTLLSENEEYKNNKVLNKALHEKNDALRVFYRQIEAENITSTMYVMCTERKKCLINQFLLNKYQSTELANKHQLVKERQEVLEALKVKEKDIVDVNADWEEKIKKILRLFLKFISFSLKLLPEQTTFLLDFEKMVVLQLNEMQKNPDSKTSILIDEKDLNCFNFEEAGKPQVLDCNEPFLLIGDTSDSIPTPHGSRETLASNVDLPIIKMNWHGIPPRKVIYAKCNRFEEVKALLEAKRCKCRDRPWSSSSLSLISAPDECGASTLTHSPSLVESESSNEPLLMDDIEILRDCPARRCKDWKREFSFPNLNNYLEYTEENYKHIKTILGKLPERDRAPELLNPKDIIMQELPFSRTHEKYHNVGTQYSSETDTSIPEFVTCPCMEKASAKINVHHNAVEETLDNDIDDILMKRKLTLQRLIHENPNLLKVFTDESFDFMYSIK